MVDICLAKRLPPDCADCSAQFSTSGTSESRDSFVFCSDRLPWKCATLWSAEKDVDTGEIGSTAADRRMISIALSPMQSKLPYSMPRAMLTGALKASLFYAVMHANRLGMPEKRTSQSSLLRIPTHSTTLTCTTSSFGLWDI